VEWVEDIIRPFSLWLSGLFNPTAYITAIMQVTARSEGLPLDKMTLETHVTRILTPEEVDYHPKDGAFCHGLFLEGARWPSLDEIEDPKDVDGTPCGGHLFDSKLKELLPLMPLVYVKAVAVEPEWEPSSVGYLRHNPGIYECPMYITTFRGPTYIYLATLESKEHVSKWTLAGVAIVFQTDD